MQSRWDTLSSGTMYLSTDLLRSKTGFISVHNFHSKTSHHSLPPFVFGKTVDGLWSPALCQDIPHSSHGGGLWPDWFRVCARMDSLLKNILPSLSCERGCRRSAMARCSEVLFMLYNAFKICHDFQCNMQPLEMHGCIDWFYNVERNTYFHQCTVLILCVVFGQSCTVL